MPRVVRHAAAGRVRRRAEADAGRIGDVGDGRSDRPAVDSQRAGVVHRRTRPVVADVHVEVVATGPRQRRRQHHHVADRPHQAAVVEADAVVVLGRRRRAQLGGEAEQRVGYQSDVHVSVDGAYRRLDAGGELETVIEERRLDDRQSHEVLHRQRSTQQLPAPVVGQVLVDVLVGVGQEVELVHVVRHRAVVARTLHVPRAPVTVDEAPRALHPHGRPLVAELRASEVRARLIARALRVAFDYLTVQPGVAARHTSTQLLEMMLQMKIYSPSGKFAERAK